ncbi:MAG: LemA family protein [Planctomycetota bacterium]|nr:LemA family protein [Planctomycetota bacterium]
MKNSPTRIPHSRRGALGTGLVILLVVGLLVLIVGGMAVSRYNALAGGKTAVAAKFAEIDNQYKRRADLIPQLVETVKGSANYEKSTLEAVVEARASVGRVQMPPDALDDPAKMQAYLNAQQQLGGALSRLLVVAEQYPDLKANAGFRDLQGQLEGTENRIAVARRDYIDSVQGYNRSLVTFPGNIVAGIFNFKEIPQLAAATEEERKVPKVEFEFGKDKEKK